MWGAEFFGDFGNELITSCVGTRKGVIVGKGGGDVETTGDERDITMDSVSLVTGEDELAMGSVTGTCKRVAVTVWRLLGAVDGEACSDSIIELLFDDKFGAEKDRFGFDGVL